MNYHLLAEQVNQYARAFFNAPEHQYLPYHNIVHTEGVVNAAIRIGNHYQLDDRDFFIVLTAAWFHDMGYYTGGPADHEQRGSMMAADFLKGLEVDELTINQVQGCIMATHLPQSPVDLREQIVCDADLFHLGTDEFRERNKLMRKEYETAYNTKINKADWRKGSIRLFESHHYQTDFCKILLDKTKHENLNALLDKQEARLNSQALEVETVRYNPAAENDQQGPKKEKGAKDSPRPDKGIETMFRVAATNHQRLSDMSDNKAHIMISVNSIIISVIIGLVVRKLDTSPNIIIPTLILLAGSMVAIVFSVLATRPRIPDGIFTKEQVDNKTVNLLFFGHFYQMSFNDYYEGMLKVMADREFLYGSLTRDIYSQGLVLGRKYKLIRVSYTVFMYTLILSILSFAIATIFFS